MLGIIDILSRDPQIPVDVSGPVASADWRLEMMGSASARRSSFVSRTTDYVCGAGFVKGLRCTEQSVAGAV